MKKKFCKHQWSCCLTRWNCTCTIRSNRRAVWGPTDSRESDRALACTNSDTTAAVTDASTTETFVSHTEETTQQGRFVTSITTFLHPEKAQKGCPGERLWPLCWDSWWRSCICIHTPAGSGFLNNALIAVQTLCSQKNEGQCFGNGQLQGQYTKGKQEIPDPLRFASGTFIIPLYQNTELSAKPCSTDKLIKALLFLMFFFEQSNVSILISSHVEI